ncbi:MAG: XRE family transcriptional regulator [Lysinibacillus sp.]
MKDIAKIVFSKNLEALLTKTGKTVSDLSSDLGISYSTVSDWKNGKKMPRGGSLQSLADYFNINLSSLLEEKPTNVIELSPATVKVPVMGKIACGDPIYAEENFNGYRYESPDTLPSGKLVYLEAKGDSMEPTIPNGSFVLIREQPEVEYGQIAAVLVNGDTEITLKRVKRQGDMVMLMPDNPNHEPYIITADNPARIVGKAIRFTQDL